MKQTHKYIQLKNMNFERNKRNSQKLTTETEEFRHGYSSKNPGRSNPHRFSQENPPKRAKKRDPKMTTKADTTRYKASKQVFMREREIRGTRTWKPYLDRAKKERGEEVREKRKREGEVRNGSI